MAASTSGAERNPIVLLHDGPDQADRLNTGRALGRIIRIYRQRGHVFPGPLGNVLPAPAG